MWKEKFEDIKALVAKQKEKGSKKNLENLVVFLIILIVTIIAINTIWKEKDKEQTNEKTNLGGKTLAIESSSNTKINQEELEQRLANGVPVATSTPVVNTVKPTPAAKPVSQPQQAAATQQPQVQQSVPVQKPTQQRYEAPRPTPITPNEAKSSDLHSLWVSILQSIDSVPTRAFYSSLAKPVEISETKITIAVKTETFATKAKEPAKMKALNDAVCRYLSITNPNIEIIIGDNVPQVAKTITPPPTPPKVEPKKDLVQQEEEEYQNNLE